MSLIFSDKARARIKSLLEQKNIDLNVGGLRLGIAGGGCNGLSYKVVLEKKPHPKDHIITLLNTSRVFIDPKSYLYLQDVTVDFYEDIFQQKFTFFNTAATFSCGCGKSFSV